MDIVERVEMLKIVEMAKIIIDAVEMLEMVELRCQFVDSVVENRGYG